MISYPLLVSKLLQSLANTIKNRFTESVHPGELSVFRFLFCLLVLYNWSWKLRTGPVLAASSLSTYFPTPLFEALGITDAPSPGTIQLLATILTVALILAAFGVFTRVSLAVATLAYFAFYGQYQGFSKIMLGLPYVSHHGNAIFFSLLILTVSPQVNYFSLERWFARRFLKWKHLKVEVIPAWPTQCLKVVLASVYFGAFWCRLVNNGLLWADGYTLQGYLLDKHIAVYAQLSLALANNFWLCRIVSVATLLLEASFVTVVFLRRGHPLIFLFLLGGLSFHLTIEMVMDIAGFLGGVGLIYFVFLDLQSLRTVGTFFGRLWSPLRIVAHKATELMPDPNRLRLRHWEKGIVLLVVLVTFGSVFARVEAWPFTDYRVFENRNHFSWVANLRYTKVSMDGTTSPLGGGDIGPGFHFFRYLQARGYLKLDETLASSEGDIRQYQKLLQEEVIRAIRVHGDEAWREIVAKMGSKKRNKIREIQIHALRPIKASDGTFSFEQELLGSFPIHSMVNQLQEDSK